MERHELTKYKSWTESVRNSCRSALTSISPERYIDNRLRHFEGNSVAIGSREQLLDTLENWAMSGLRFMEKVNTHKNFEILGAPIVLCFYLDDSLLMGTVSQVVSFGNEESNQWIPAITIGRLRDNWYRAYYLSEDEMEKEFEYWLTPEDNDELL